MTADQELLRVINGSGFPLQIAVQHLVEQEGGRDWRVRHKEHAWTNPTNKMSGFIDIVLQHSQTKDSLVLECKRVQNAAWLFLSHKEAMNTRQHCKVWSTNFKVDPPFFGWADVAVPLETPEAQFCCLRGQSSNDKNTFLERVAGELVSATEALAHEERYYRNDQVKSCRFYLNVIVTTAQLHFAAYDKTALNLADGSLSRAEFHRVPYLRVRKQFSMRPVALTPTDFNQNVDTDYRRENTVFVVEAVHLLDFLHKINLVDINC